MLTERVRAWEAEGGYEEVAGRRLFVCPAGRRGTAAAAPARLPVELVRLAAAARAAAGAGRRWRSTASASGCRRSRRASSTRSAGRPTRRRRWSTAARCSWSGTTWARRSRPSCSRATCAASCGCAIAGVLLFNGSILLHRRARRSGRRSCARALGPLFARLNSERTFTAQFARIFSDAPPARARRGARPVGAARAPRRSPPPAGDDQLHERARALHRPLARRRARLAGRAQPRLGPRGSRRDHGGARRAARAAAGRARDRAAPASATTRRSRRRSGSPRRSTPP